MARTSMEDLLGGDPEPAPPVFPQRPKAAPEPEPEQTEPEPAAVVEPAAPQDRKPRRPAKRRPAVKAQRLDRKEAQLRPDQLDDLTAVARRLNRARGAGHPERLTENTLIRIGVDLLLAAAGDLAGATEDELRESVLPDVRTSGSNRLRKSRTAGG